MGSRGGIEFKNVKMQYKLGLRYPLTTSLSRWLLVRR